MDDNNDYERMADEATNMISSVLPQLTAGDVIQFNDLVENNDIVGAYELARQLQVDKWAISLSKPPKPVIDPADAFRTDDGLLDILTGDETTVY